MVTAITSIALRSQQYLGDTLREIAVEKAGIIKPGVPVVVGRLRRAARPSIARSRASAARRSCGAGRRAVDDRRPGDRRGSHACTPARDYGAITLALAGAHQIGNAVVAVRMLEALDDSGIARAADAVVDGPGAA